MWELTNVRNGEMIMNNTPMYMFSIVRGPREAKIYSSMELDDYYRVECLLDGELVVARDNSELDYCREVGEAFVLEQS